MQAGVEGTALEALFPGNLEAKKALLFRLYGYQYHADEVREFHRSQVHTRIVSAPARTSKSYAAAKDAHAFLWPDLDPETLTPTLALNLGWIVVPDYKTAKEFGYLFEDLVDNRHKSPLGGYQLERAVNNPTQGNMEISIVWGRTRTGEIARSVVQVKSSGNPSSIQSEELQWAILSEAASQQEEIYMKYLATRVSRSLVMPTTPGGPGEWIYRMIQAGEKDSSLDIAHFTFPPRANPMYDWSRYRRAERFAIARTGGDPEKDPWFAEQFLGHWTFAEGRVLPFRWRTGMRGEVSHVLSTPPLWIEDARWYVTTDYGFSDTACALWLAVGPDGTIVVMRELYEKQLHAAKFVSKIRDMTLERVQWYIADPQKPEVTAIMREHGLPLFSMSAAKQRDRAAGFHRLGDLLMDDPKTGAPKLYVYKDCENTINEFAHLRMKPGARNEWAEGSMIGADHAISSLRYACMTPLWGQQISEVAREIEKLRQQVLARKRRMPPQIQGGMRGSVPSRWSA